MPTTTPIPTLVHQDTAHLSTAPVAPVVQGPVPPQKGIEKNGLEIVTITNEGAIRGEIEIELVSCNSENFT